MTTDAIEKDVSKEKAPEVADPRETLIDSIVDKNNAEMTDETPQEDEPTGSAEGGVIDPDKQDDDVEEVEITVDGEKQTVPLSKIMDAGKRALQKESAADKRLEEATRLLKEAKETKPPPEEPGDAEAPMTAQEIAEALQYGTAEDAAKAIEQLNNQGRSNNDAATPDKIKELVTQTVTETTNTKEIVSRFELPEDQGGYQDVIKDPYLREKAISIVNEKLASGEPNTWDTYAKAGDEVREWMVKIGARKPSTIEDKKNKKRSTDTVRAATATKGSTDPGEKPKTASDVIREMAAARPGSGG